MAENSGEDDCIGGESTKTELAPDISDGSVPFDSELDAGECSACWMISLPLESSSAIPSQSLCQNFSLDRDKLTKSRT